MGYYPIFLELQGRRCLVIGGGEVASRKAAALVACGARVKVVGPALGAGLKRLCRRGRIQWIRRRFQPADLQGVGLAVAATDDRQVNERAARDARRRRIWINVSDQPKLCTFIVPAVVRRGKLVLAVSTGGASPALARWIRKDLQERYGAGHARLLAAAARARRQAQRKVPGAAARKRMFERALRAYFQVIKRASS